jgi:hypothetical protein
MTTAQIRVLATDELNAMSSIQIAAIETADLVAFLLDPESPINRR